MASHHKHPLRDPNILCSHSPPHPTVQRMSLNRAVSSSSIRSATISPQKEHVGIKCACGHDAVRLVSKTKKNPDRYCISPQTHPLPTSKRPFYKCPEEGCKLFKWEDEISGPSHQMQSGPLTPSSSQSQSSQATMQTPARASTSSSSQVKTPWTNQTPIRPPMSTNPNKRKRSLSLSPTPSPSTTIIHGKDDVVASSSRPSLALGPFGTEANAFSRSVANPVASTSAGSDLPSPKKRARVDNTSAAGSIFSDDEDLWADVALDASLDVNQEITIPSAQPLKKSVSFQELKDGDDENINDEDGILVDTGRLRLLDFENKRGPSPDRLINLHVRDGTTDNFPIIDDDPSNPFITHKTPNKPSTSYTNGTPARTPSALAASSSFAGPSSVGTLSANTSPAFTNPMPTLLRLEELLPDLVSAVPDLIQKIAKLERKQVADAKSIEFKLQRIRELTEVVEGLKEEVASLKEENAQLRGT